MLTGENFFVENIKSTSKLTKPRPALISKSSGMFKQLESVPGFDRILLETFMLLEKFYRTS